MACANRLYLAVFFYERLEASLGPVRWRRLARRGRFSRSTCSNAYLSACIYRGESRGIKRGTVARESLRKIKPRVREPLSCMSDAYFSV